MMGSRRGISGFHAKWFPTKQNKVTLRVVMASPAPLAIYAVPAPWKAD